MAPLLNTLISRIVFGETKKKNGDLPRPASIAFSEGDFPGSYHRMVSAPHSPARGTSAVNSPLKGASLQSVASPGQLQSSPPVASVNANSNKHVASYSTAQDDSSAAEQQASTSGANGFRTQHREAAPRPEDASNHVHQSQQLPSNSSEGSTYAQPKTSSAIAPTQDQAVSATSSNDQTEHYKPKCMSSNTDPHIHVSNEGSNSERAQEQNAGADSEQEAVEAETMLSSRGDLTSLVQGTNDLISQLAARTL